MKDRLKAAATEGLVFGVRWAVAFLVIAAAVLIVLGDYTVTRTRANFAYEVVQQSIAAQQQRAQQPAQQPAR